MDLQQALRVEGGSRLALVGAGGKTSALFLLGEQVPGPAVLTTSTHISLEQARRADRHWEVTRPEEVDLALAAAGEVKTTLVTGPRRTDGRTGALGADLLERIRLVCEQNDYPLFIEADGARTWPLKAPAEHEPVIPDWVDAVVVCAGLSGLCQPLAEETVHRPEIFAALSGLSLGSPITPAAVAQVLLHERGGLKGIPPGARKVALLNQADTPELQAVAKKMASELLAGGYDSVVVAALKTRLVLAAFEQVAGVVLAAGSAQRFGQPKVLLEWQGEALVRHAARTALHAGLKPVRVVTGVHDTAIRAALSDLEVEIIPNPNWEQGQSTSVSAGLAGIEIRCGAAIFLLADQPLVTADVLRELTDNHASSLSAIVAPRVNGQRANPVLFDRVTFADLRKLRGDRGGRSLFERYPVAWVDSDNTGLLFDIDTPEDYRQLLAMQPEEK